MAAITLKRRSWWGRVKIFPGAFAGIRRVFRSQGIGPIKSAWYAWRCAKSIVRFDPRAVQLSQRAKKELRKGEKSRRKRERRRLKGVKR